MFSYQFNYLTLHHSIKHLLHAREIILDFGSQTTQLIGRRLRELNMYCEIVPYNRFPKDAHDVKGVILSGSPYSVNDESAFKADLSEIRENTRYLEFAMGAVPGIYIGRKSRIGRLS